MKKYILSAIMLLAVLAVGAKNAGQARAIVLNLTDGTVLSVNIHSGLTIAFEGEDAVIKGVNDKNEAVTLSKPLAEISSWTLSETTGPELSGIAGATADASPAVALDGMAVAGLKAGAEVRVVNAAGQTVAQLRAGADGKAALPFASLAPGIYIISTPGGTLKVAVP
ncbi:MAG: hypothetical protein NC484_04905 [Alloprevotella sp.]|nr:hypothetical protein [Alloprevotella sp.]